MDLINIIDFVPDTLFIIIKEDKSIIKVNIPPFKTPLI
jgi:hypothetical protein